MGETEGKYALFCEENFAVNVQGYEVGENARMFKAELSEVCDTCVGGDIDTWAAEAELRALCAFADTYACDFFFGPGTRLVIEKTVTI